MDIEHDPFDLGHSAAFHAEPLSSNPFTPGTSDHAKWHSGWYRASDEINSMLDALLDLYCPKSEF